MKERTITEIAADLRAIAVGLDLDNGLVAAKLHECADKLDAAAGLISIEYDGEGRVRARFYRAPGAAFPSLGDSPKIRPIASRNTVKRK